MSRGQRGIGLNKPCPRCGAEVPSMFKSPVMEGLCGKCTDEALRSRQPKGAGQTARLVRAVPGGGSTIAGFAIGIGAGILLSLAVSIFAPGLWADLSGGIGGLFGR